MFWKRKTQFRDVPKGFNDKYLPYSNINLSLNPS